DQVDAALQPEAGSSGTGAAHVEAAAGELDSDGVVRSVLVCREVVQGGLDACDHIARLASPPVPGPVGVAVLDPVKALWVVRGVRQSSRNGRKRLGGNGCCRA